MFTSSAMAALQQCPLLTIEDVIRFLPDNRYVPPFFAFFLMYPYCFPLLSSTQVCSLVVRLRTSVTKSASALRSLIVACSS
jgi:hypothetical protein